MQFLYKIGINPVLISTGSVSVVIDTSSGDVQHLNRK